MENVSLSESAKRRSTRICGVHVHIFPADDSGGYADEANEVGERGEKNGTSWPATTEVRAVSRLSVAVLRRRNPDAVPLLEIGKPPQKSTLISPLVLAPFHSGPNTSIFSRDWRAD